MFGFSIFASDGPLDIAYIEAMAAAGFGGVFTSAHIPEDDPGKYRAFLEPLGEATKRLGLNLTVDVSGNALERAGFSFSDLGTLREIGVTGLRADFHISNEQIAVASHEIEMALNASTVTENDVAELARFDADFDKLLAWHNYYPRPETGLGAKDFWAKNHFLKSRDFRVVAFTPGDARLRAPLREGLPTLERHRYGNPLAGALDLVQNCEVDDVYIGDGGLSGRTREQFAAYLKDGEVLLFAKKYGELFDYVASHDHVNRHDAARDALRSAEARFWTVPDVPQENTIARKKGSITIDNVDYGRYRGDIQVTTRRLPADDRVNVVGRVIERDRGLLKQIKGGMGFRVKSVG
ncbi:MAG: MupG family TIM beta-alpha barrel fold protein [Promicromonosporaceae bacterium]|nr:MupG family TIM beta-alpha barrel fold protein [Promicromonosporaceae bacterium]